MAYDRTSLVTAAQRRLEEAPGTRLSDVASACGVSCATLARAMRAETARSYRHVQRDHLKSKAQALLLEQPQRSVKELAYTLGFATPQSFARWHTQVTGYPPSVYRQTVRDAGGPPCADLASVRQ